MAGWEYTMITGSSADWAAFQVALNAAGRNGWEAFGITPAHAYSKGGNVPTSSGFEAQQLTVLLKHPLG